MSILPALKFKFFQLVHSDGFKRASHTFYQAFLATFIAGIPLVMSATKVGVPAGRAALISLATGAVAAGLSAVKSLILAKS